MLFIILIISVASLIVSIFELMKDNSLRFVVAPILGILFGYFIYSFALGIYIFVLLPILILPIVAMVILLNNK